MADAARIVVRVNKNETESGEAGVDIYDPNTPDLTKTPASINGRWFVRATIAKNDVRVDGPSVDKVSWPWSEHVHRVHDLEWIQLRGLNPISERVVKRIATTIHIRSSRIARDTKLGSEEVTCDIPNVGEGALAK